MHIAGLLRKLITPSRTPLDGLITVALWIWWSAARPPWPVLLAAMAAAPFAAGFLKVAVSDTADWGDRARGARANGTQGPEAERL